MARSSARGTGNYLGQNRATKSSDGQAAVEREDGPRRRDPAGGMRPGSDGIIPAMTLDEPDDGGDVHDETSGDLPTGLLASTVGLDDLGRQIDCTA